MRLFERPTGRSLYGPRLGYPFPAHILLQRRSFCFGVQTGCFTHVLHKSDQKIVFTE